MIKNLILKINFENGNFLFKIKGARTGNVLVLLFHTFIESKNQLESNHIIKEGSINLFYFETIIKCLLENGYIFISQNDLLSKKFESEKKYVMITLDDGYFNNFLILDIIKKYNVPLTLFVNSYNILENKKYWWDVVYFYEKNKHTNVKNINKIIKNYTHKPFNIIKKDILKKYGFDCEKPLSDIDRPMTIEELKLFHSEKLINIGNHLKYHSTSVSQNIDNFMKEFKACDKDIYDILKINPISFAYPNGFNSIDHHKSIIKNNYKLIFTGDNKLNNINLINNNNVNIIGRFSFRADINKLNQLNTFISNNDLIFWIKRILKIN